MLAITEQSEPFWAVARTHPNCENIAITNLKRQSFDYYQPLIIERKIVRGRAKKVISPLFPCYLFVQIEQQWTVLQSTYGIAAVLAMGSKPSKIPENVINDLRSREDSSGVITLPKKRIANGDTVRIKDGPFADQLALVDRMPASDRQNVLLSLLSGKIKVLVAENSIEVAA